MSEYEAIQENGFREVFRKLHAGHDTCLGDEWLMQPCGVAGAVADRPVAYSRRNGPWRRVDIVWCGAAPGNAGGRGSGDLGAHGTRIPFGGDIAGGNFDVLLSSVGLDRNNTFVVAALNELPAAGGGEPTFAELSAPRGDFPSSVHAVRDTLIAAGPRLIVALGNVGLRVAIGAAQLNGRLEKLPAVERLRKSGMERHVASGWPESEAPTDAFIAEWEAAWGDAPLPHILWLTHPSAQNMSPYAGRETIFHRRMVEARDALRRGVAETLGWELPVERPEIPAAGDGVYALPEWRERIAPRHIDMDRLWREKGV